MTIRVSLTLALLFATPAAAQVAVPAPATPLARAQALAIVQTLNARLLAAPSATETLRQWCAEHRMADPAVIRAVRVAGADHPITAEQRLRLDIGPRERVVYRRVRLMCGDHIMSEAENWYVPSRLTRAMNRALTQTDTPFGTAIRPLRPSRRTVSAELLWSPLSPVGWEMPDGDVPREILRHRAIVSRGDGKPLAEVVETYTRDVLAFAVPWVGPVTPSSARR